MLIRRKAEKRCGRKGWCGISPKQLKGNFLIIDRRNCTLKWGQCFQGLWDAEGWMLEDREQAQHKAGGGWVLFTWPLESTSSASCSLRGSFQSKSLSRKVVEFTSWYVCPTPNMVCCWLFSKLSTFHTLSVLVFWVFFFSWLMTWEVIHPPFIEFAELVIINLSGNINAYSFVLLQCLWTSSFTEWVNWNVHFSL